MIMERISNPMFTYQYGDIELTNIINHDRSYDDEKLPKMTLTEFINKIKNNEEVQAGTFVYFTLHDLVDDNDTRYMHDTFTHIPTDTKIEVEYDEQIEDWTRIFILVDGKKIWIGDDPNGEFIDMVVPYGDTNAFEFQSFQEWS